LEKRELTLSSPLLWNSSSIEIASKISEETINYAYAIDQSIRASILILLKAHDALSIHHKVEELTREDIQTLHDLSVSAGKEQEKTSQLFNIVDQDVCKVRYGFSMVPCVC